MMTEITATTLMWHTSVALLYTNECYWKVAHSHTVVKCKWLLQILNKMLYSGRIKATCCNKTK